MKKIILIFVTLLLYTNLSSQTTTIYLFRHAEKETHNPKDRNPNLNMERQKRAARLNHMFKNKKVNALFSTAYNRTEQTITPLAETHQLPIQKYDPKKLKELASTIIQQYSGQNTIVVGHSNTLFPLAKEFGVPNADQEISESDYNTYLVIKLKRNKATLSIKQY